MKKENTQLAGIYTAPSCKVINIELEGAILESSGSTENVGDDINYGW